MVTADFSQPRRQSSKGILVIFGFKTFKFFKSFFVLFVAFGISIFQKKSFANFGLFNIVLIVIGLLLVILIISVLNYLNFKFYVKNEDFHLSTGILNKDNTIIPKSKIQNVYIKQNFLQQIINVVSVNIETAGDDKSEIEISALDKIQAKQLKELLFSKNKVSEGIQTEAEDIEDDVFFRASLKRLFLEGISQNHLKSFLIIVSFIFGLYYEAKDYVKQLNIEEQFENSTIFNDEALFGLLVTNVVIVLLFLFVSVLFSVVKTVVVNFNLEVVEHQKTVEINKGLFNKMSLSLTPSRIQNLEVKTNRIKRYFGLYRLSVKQAMVNKKQQKNFAIVALEKSQLDYLINRLLGAYDATTERQKPEFYYKRILWLKLSVLAVLLNIPAYFFLGTYFWAINIPLVLLMFTFVHFKYKKAYYFISEEHITIGSGFIDSVTNILEIHKIQSVRFQQTFFQKQQDIASIIVSTASKDVTIPYIKSAHAKTICNLLLYSVESQDRDWM